MWLFTTVGFFSVVQKANQQGLTVRARVKEDIDRLRAKYMPALTATVTGGGADYPFRATISHDDFALGLAQIAHDIRYANFKSEIARTQGVKREAAYGKVWATLQALEHEVQPAKTGKKAAAKVELKPAFGGVVINRHGQVLLMEPRNHFDGYVWTFAKGRPNSGETPEAAAMREVYEETGVRARIERPIPGTFEGGTTLTTYFLMSMVRDTKQFGKETQAIKWATEDEAEEMIGQTTNLVGRERDLKVLQAGFDLQRSRGNRP
jgi:8-oxo-dGTP pyrophosphatase MutT (NUDIX family)